MKTGKTIGNILLIGLATTAVRLLGQLCLPAGEQSVLSPSVFARNGTMPLAFTLYGILAYSLIAALFLLIQPRMPGRGLTRGLSYGLCCCAIWTVYLWEPLPHVAPLDRVTYPLVDGLALLLMGALLGWRFPGPGQRAERRRERWPRAPLLVLVLCFLAGRMALYVGADLYSCFSHRPVFTLLWCLLTGGTVACAMAWLNRFVIGGRLRRALTLGGLLFGGNLTLFNFFMRGVRRRSARPDPPHAGGCGGGERGVPFLPRPAGAGTAPWPVSAEPDWANGWARPPYPMPCASPSATSSPGSRPGGLACRRRRSSTCGCV